jgi:hypothetical protein
MVIAVVKNVERVLAIELLAAVQALEFSAPLKTTGTFFFLLDSFSSSFILVFLPLLLSLFRCE